MFAVKFDDSKPGRRFQHKLDVGSRTAGEPFASTGILFLLGSPGKESTHTTSHAPSVHPTST